MHHTPHIPTGFSLTSHARLRQQQRAVDPDALRLVLMDGVDLPAGRGCQRRYLPAFKIAEMYGEGYSERVLRQASRIVVVVTDQGEVITEYKSDPQRRRKARAGSYRRSQRAHYRSR